MAYVPGYDHDVFVSYAHLDNEGESAWVTNLVRRLSIEVRQRLGAKDPKIWIDHDLNGNDPLTPEIMQAIRRSATILLIVSPSYITSEWCARERNAFLGFAQNCVAEGRIFIVHCRDIGRQLMPPEFGDLKGFKFWTKDSDAGGVARERAEFLARPHVPKPNRPIETAGDRALAVGGERHALNPFRVARERA